MPQATQALAQTSEATTREPLLEQAIAATDRHKSLVGSAANILGVAPDKLCPLLRNVWTTSKGQPPLTDSEMFTGISMIARYELDPIAREIYVTRDNKGRLMTIIGIDGWVKILDRTDHYDGFDWKYSFDESGKVLEWVEVAIHSTKRSHPTVYRGYAKEYAKLGGFMAEKIPWHMLRLFTLRHAGRLFTPLGGNVLTEEEARWMSDRQDQFIPGPAPSLDEITERLKGNKTETTDAPADHAATPAEEADAYKLGQDTWRNRKDRKAIEKDVPRLVRPHYREGWRNEKAADERAESTEPPHHEAAAEEAGAVVEDQTPVGTRTIPRTVFQFELPPNCDEPTQDFIAVDCTGALNKCESLTTVGQAVAELSVSIKGNIKKIIESMGDQRRATITGAR